VKNRLKRLLEAGETAFGAQLRFGSPAIAEMFGLAGFDYLVLDGEHAPQTPVGIQSQLQAIAATPATPVVRLGKNDPELMRVYLDMGATAVLVPMVSTAEEAKRGADACRYPPRGTRGFGPARADGYGFDPDYFARSDEEMLYIPIIETAEALENLDEILAVDGVDTFIVGPCDLSISLGIPHDLEHPRFREAVRRMARAARDAGKPAGMSVYGDAFHPDTLRSFMDQGFPLLLIGGDQWLLQGVCRRVLDVYAQARTGKERDACGA